MAVDLHVFQPGESGEQARTYLNSSLASIVAELLLKAAAATTLSGYGITNAYTKTEVDSALSSKATDSAVVHKSGDESISGTKSFTNNDTFFGVKANAYADVGNLGTNQVWLDARSDANADVDIMLRTKGNGNALFSTVKGFFYRVLRVGHDNSQNGQMLEVNGSDHVYFAWMVNLARKAYIGFPGAGNTVFQIVNEFTNGDINFQTNGTGKVKVNGVEIGTGGGTGTAKICYEGYLPGVQVVGSTWVNVSGQAIPTSSKFKICLSVLPTGENFIVELRKNGTAIATATIATTDTATNGMYINDATTSGAIAENDKLEVYITQVGSTVSGSNFSFQLVSA